MYNFKNIDELLKQAAFEEEILMSFIYPMKDILIDSVINPILNGEITETSLPNITFITSTGYNALIENIIRDYMNKGEASTRAEAQKLMRSIKLKERILDKFNKLLIVVLNKYKGKLGSAENSIRSVYKNSFEQELQNVR